MSTVEMLNHPLELVYLKNSVTIRWTYLTESEFKHFPQFLKIQKSQKIYDNYNNNFKKFKKTIKNENKPTMKDETSRLSLMSDLKSIISNLKFNF